MPLVHTFAPYFRHLHRSGKIDMIELWRNSYFFSLCYFRHLYRSAKIDMIELWLTSYYTMWLCLHVLFFRSMIELWLNSYYTMSLCLHVLFFRSMIELWLNSYYTMWLCSHVLFFRRKTTYYCCFSVSLKYSGAQEKAGWKHAQSVMNAVCRNSSRKASKDIGE